MSNKKINIADTLKSQDTEEWLDLYFTRPIGFLWAKLFDRFGIHPNVVTILSIFIGVAAGVMFYYNDIWHNIAGVLLLMWANIYDSTDGQLARMTGKKTKWGRILDGFAGDMWFITIYAAICLRLMPHSIPLTDVPWGWSIFLLGALAGIVCHSRQSQLADYYRNIHLFFMKGESGSELDTSRKQREILDNTPRKGNFWWRAFLWGYAGYTSKQEGMTPDFQKLMRYMKDKNLDTLPEHLREEFLDRSRPLMKYANFLTFNARAITLYASCLAGVPWLYFVVEITLFTAVYMYMRHKHEAACRYILDKLKVEQ